MDTTEVSIDATESLVTITESSVTTTDSLITQMAICKENPSTYTSNVANIYQGFNGAMQIADRRNVGVDKLNENFYRSKQCS